MKQVPLNDEANFHLVNGLWKGERAPLKHAKVLRAKNFAGDGLLDFDDVVELEVEERHFPERQLARGDIVVERSGGGPKQPVGRVALFIPPDEFPYFSSNFTTALRIRDRATFDPAYVALYLHALYLDGGTTTLQRATTGIRNLDWHEYLRFEVPARPLDEQKRLVDLIGGIRKAYRIDDELIDVLAELKQTTMRELFSRGLRGEAQRETEIGPIPESWATARLNAVADVISTRMSYTELLNTAPTENPDAVRVFGVKVSDMNAAGNEVEIVGSALDLLIDHNTAKRRCAPPETIIFPKRGAAIATNKKRIAREWTVFDPNVIGVVAHEGLCQRFLFHWFQSFDLRTITEPGPTPQLNKKNLEPLNIPVPPTAEEQHEIAEVLDALDRKIDLHRRKRAVLDQLFKSLLHKLMTGEVSVDEFDLSALPSTDGSAA